MFGPNQGVANRDRPYSDFSPWALRGHWGIQACNVDFAARETRLDVRIDKNTEGRLLPMTVELRGLLKPMADALRVKKQKLRKRCQFKERPNLVLRGCFGVTAGQSAPSARARTRPATKPACP